MTSTVSTAKTRKESFFRHYFLMGFRRTRKAMIILSVLQIIGIPLTEILMTVTLKADLAEKYDSDGQNKFQFSHYASFFLFPAAKVW